MRTVVANVEVTLSDHKDSKYTLGNAFGAWRAATSLISRLGLQKQLEKTFHGNKMLFPFS